MANELSYDTGQPLRITFAEDANFTAEDTLTLEESREPGVPDVPSGFPLKAARIDPPRRSFVADYRATAPSEVRFEGACNLCNTVRSTMPPPHDVTACDDLADLINLALQVGRNREPMKKLIDALEPFGVRRKK